MLDSNIAWGTVLNKLLEQLRDALYGEATLDQIANVARLIQGVTEGNFPLTLDYVLPLIKGMHPRTVMTDAVWIWVLTDGWVLATQHDEVAHQQLRKAFGGLPRIDQLPASRHIDHFLASVWSETHTSTAYGNTMESTIHRTLDEDFKTWTARRLCQSMMRLPDIAEEYGEIIAGPEEDVDTAEISVMASMWHVVETEIQPLIDKTLMELWGRNAFNQYDDALDVMVADDLDDAPVFEFSWQDAPILTLVLPRTSSSQWTMIHGSVILSFDGTPEQFNSVCKAVVDGVDAYDYPTNLKDLLYLIEQGSWSRDTLEMPTFFDKSADPIPMPAHLEALGWVVWAWDEREALVSPDSDPYDPDGLVIVSLDYKKRAP